jgi:cytochrome c biogenesis protein CcmG, thiol:disulfide interchange protein DsbE
MSDAGQQAPPRRRGYLALLPLIFFTGLALLFLGRLFAGDPGKLPSALVGRMAPQFSLAGLGEGPGLSDADLKKSKLTLVNVFASWCVPCHEEHPLLMELAKDRRFTLAGLNYKDNAENARRFLGAKGNPYALVGADIAGRVGIDWGVYGVPETFVVRGDGAIVYKIVGPLSPEIIRDTLMPQIEKALGK